MDSRSRTEPASEFGSIDPEAFENELIRLYRQEYQKNGISTRLCRHLHIPLQSGSDKILKLMRRTYQTNHFFSLIKKLRRQIPGLTISTDLIIGFPGENESDFKKSKEYINRFLTLEPEAEERPQLQQVLDQIRQLGY